MRRREFIKFKNKKINGEFSDFELKEFVEEIKEYSLLCKSIGIKIKMNKNKHNNKKQVKMNKQQNLEEIVMVVEYVKHKKVEGTLYLMNERIAWMPKAKNFFTVSHHYADIKSKKETKLKIKNSFILLVILVI